MPQIALQSKDLIITQDGDLEIRPDEGYHALSKVEIVVGDRHQETVQNVLTVPDRVFQDKVQITKLRGVTRVWNQLIDPTNLATTTYVNVTVTNNGDGSLTITNTASGTSDFKITTNAFGVGGHTYLLIGAKSTAMLGISDGSMRYDLGNGKIFTASATMNLYFHADNGTTYNETIKPCVFDLTLIFGAGNEPSTVAEALDAIPALGRYNDYDTESLVDTTYESVEAEGRNLADVYATRTYIDITNGSLQTETVDGWLLTSPHKMTSTTFVQSGVTVSNSVRYRVLNSDNEVIDYGYTVNGTNGSFTVSTFGWYIQFCFRITDEDTIQIEVGSTATTYTAPIDPTTLTLPEPVTLRSAGSVADTDELCVEVDGVEKRRQTVRVGQVDLGTIPNWVLDSDGFYRTTLDDILPPSGSSSIRLTCDKYVPISPQYSGGMSEQADKTICQSANPNGTTKVIYVKDSGGTPIGILNYALADPIVTLTDPILDNFVLAEAGGSVKLIQDNTPEIDTSFDVDYLTI